jgi:hypothetical protein
MSEKNSVFVELYDLVITGRTDDRFGRVVTGKTLNEDDLIKIAVSRRTDLNPVTLKASFDILKEVAMEQLANGASVSFGLGYFGLEVKGVFIGDNAKWDSKQHSLAIRVTPTAALRKTVREVSVNVRGMASVGVAINTLTDVASGEVNARLTPGGGVNLAGSKIKIIGDSPSNGVSLINQADETAVKIPATAILINDPSKISFVVPADLPAGDYRLSITTQYSSGAQTLKVPRTCVLEYILTV